MRITELQLGKYYRRQSWGDNPMIVEIVEFPKYEKEHRLRIVNSNDRFQSFYSICLEDISADDWYEVSL